MVSSVSDDKTNDAIRLISWNDHKLAQNVTIEGLLEDGEGRHGAPIAPTKTVLTSERKRIQILMVMGHDRNERESSTLE